MHPKLELFHHLGSLKALLKTDIERLSIDTYSKIYTYKRNDSTILFRLIKDENHNLLIVMPSISDKPHKAKEIDGIIHLYDPALKTTLIFKTRRLVKSLFASEHIKLPSLNNIQDLIDFINSLSAPDLSLVIDNVNLITEY